MIFHARTDSYLVMNITFTMIIVAAFVWFPIIFYLETPSPALIFTALLFSIICEGLLTWMMFRKYALHNDYVLIKGGPFSLKIPYNEITHVEHTNSTYIGYRILSAKKGIDIHHQTAKNGSTKISPKNEVQFLQVLKKRCPHAIFIEK